MKKKNKQRQYNQNIVKRVFFITKQTNYHINEMCAYEGLSERQGGRIIDKLVRNDRATKKREVLGMNNTVSTIIAAVLFVAYIAGIVILLRDN